MAEILVAYSSISGQTQKIAEALAGELRQKRHTVAVLDVDALREDYDIGKFDAVLIGAPVYRSHYPFAMRHWAKTHSHELSERPGAFFSVSLGILDKKHPAVQETERKIMREFFAESDWTPERWVSFAGALLYLEYNWFVRWIMKGIAWKAGGDTDTRRNYEYTDWEAVKAFASEFSRFVIERVSKKAERQRAG